MIAIKSQQEIEKMRESNRIVGDLLVNLKKVIKPGISTLQVEKYANNFILEQGGIPAFKGYSIPGLSPFPAAICASINSCIVHGIPRKDVILEEGDIIGVDVGVLKDEFYGDAAYTYRVGNISERANKLMQITKEALNIGISRAKVGNRVGDISYAIGSFVAKKGYYVADNLTGHGIGRNLHEDPIVPNNGFAGKGPRLRKGMTIAIEPMVNIGTNEVLENGWEFFTGDDSLSAHFEKTILITNEEPEILSIW